MPGARPEQSGPLSTLWRDVWGYQSQGRTRSVDAHAGRLRRRLAPHLVANVRGVGYRLTLTPVVAPRRA